MHRDNLKDPQRYAVCLGAGMDPMLVLDRLKKGNHQAKRRYEMVVNKAAAAVAARGDAPLSRKKQRTAGPESEAKPSPGKGKGKGKRAKAAKPAAGKAAPTVKPDPERVHNWLGKGPRTKTGAAMRQRVEAFSFQDDVSTASDASSVAFLDDPAAATACASPEAAVQVVTEVNSWDEDLLAQVWDQEQEDLLCDINFGLADIDTGDAPAVRPVPSAATPAVSVAVAPSVAAPSAVATAPMAMPLSYASAPMPSSMARCTATTAAPPVSAPMVPSGLSVFDHQGLVAAATSLGLQGLVENMCMDAANGGPNVAVELGRMLRLRQLYTLAQARAQLIGAAASIPLWMLAASAEFPIQLSN